MRCFLFVFTLFVSSFNVLAQSEVYELCDVKNVHPKKEILQAIDHESDTMKSLVLAVSGIETEHFTVDYPNCDNKKHDACNIGIFKINIALVKEIIGDDLTDDLKNKIIDDRGIATNIFVEGVKKLGKENMLRLHRGGAGWKQFRHNEIEAYINAIDSLQEKWLQRPEELDAETTSCLRYTIDVAPI